MTFDKWCEEKDIKGYYKKALVEMLMSTNAPNSPADWESAYKRLLSDTADRLLKEG